MNSSDRIAVTMHETPNGFAGVSYQKVCPGGMFTSPLTGRH
jgi:hypothetical protein